MNAADIDGAEWVRTMTMAVVPEVVEMLQPAQVNKCPAGHGCCDMC